MSAQQWEPGPEGPRQSGSQPVPPYGGPPPYGPGMPPRPPCPTQVSIAMALWIILNGFLMLGSFGLYLSRGPYGSGSPNVSSSALLFCLGLVGLIMATQLKSGSKAARITLTILGGFELLGLWPALFVVPALILQYRPISNAWFHDVNAPRFPPPGPPMPPPPPPSA